LYSVCTLLSPTDAVDHDPVLKRVLGELVQDPLNTEQAFYLARQVNDLLRDWLDLYLATSLESASEAEAGPAQQSVKARYGFQIIDFIICNPFLKRCSSIF
jgi:hypothetical protein